LRDGAKRDRSQKPEGRVDDSAWIHRDKLAQIEIQEMQEAGIPVRPRRSMSADPEGRSRRTSRSMSRTGRHASESHDGNEVGRDGDYAAAYPGTEELERSRISSIPSAVEDDYATQHEEPSADARLPDSTTEAPFQRQHVMRPSTSRIPIAATTAGGTGRESPNDTRTAGAWSGKWDELRKEKGRSNSASSHVLLDDLDTGRATPLDPLDAKAKSDQSPPKPRTAKKVSPNGRQTSAATRPGSSHKPGARAVSAKRPGSSQRLSASYPEGEAPWISSMYKPDPRLPPDQQMLPTHAKRMMQEMWEKEGKTGTVYDRDFNLLNDQELPGPKPSAAPVSDQDHQNQPPHGSNAAVNGQTTSPASADINSWPLTPKSDVRSEDGNARPSTSGGYRITPSIPNMPVIERPLGSPTNANPNPVPRIQDLPEKDEAQPKKGCCCVMM
jgi:hypothetical protein